MRLEFLDLLLEARNAPGIRNKTKLIASILIDVIGYHLGSRHFTDTLTKPLLKSTMVVAGDCKFYLLDRESMSIVSARLGFEEFMKPWLHIKADDVVIDVGAHVGKYTVSFARKAAQVIAMEPSRETYQVLVRNIIANGLKNVVPLNLAAWNERTQMTLFRGPTPAQHSLKRSFKESEDILTETIDTIVDLQRLPRVDWIKVDVEQAEVEALEGAQITMRKMKPRIIVEVWLRNKHRMRELLKKNEYGAICISSSLHPAGCWYWLILPLS